MSKKEEKEESNSYKTFRKGYVEIHNACMCCSEDEITARRANQLHVLR